MTYCKDCGNNLTTPAFTPYQVGQNLGWVTQEDVDYHSLWKPATNGAVKGWAVCRHGNQPQWHSNRAGRIITYRSLGAAQRKASELNERDNL